MKLKLDDAGHVVVADGKPVYLFDDGKEAPFDVPDMYGKLSRDGKRNADLQKAVEAAEGRLKAFEDIGDPSVALKALETIKNLDMKKLVDAGEVEKVKAEAVRAMEERIKAVEAKIDPLKKERDEFRGALHAEKIGHAFAGSKFISEKMATNIKANMASALFGSRFKVEDGGIVGHDLAGNKIFSLEKPGEAAGFDEALNVMVDQHPDRDSLLRGTGASGGGAQGGGSGGNRVVTRAQFDKMDPVTQAKTAMQAGKGEVTLTD